MIPIETDRDRSVAPQIVFLGPPTVVAKPTYNGNQVEQFVLACT